MKPHRPRTRLQKEKALMQTHREWKKRDSRKAKKPVSLNFDDVEVSSDDECMQNCMDSDDSDVRIVDGPSESRSEMKEIYSDLGTADCPIMMISDDESEEEEEEEEESEEGRGSGGGVGREESEEEYESETEESESELESESEGEEESESEDEDVGYGFIEFKVKSKGKIRKGSNSKNVGTSKKSVKIPVKKNGSDCCPLALSDDESEEESEEEDAGCKFRDSRNDFREKIVGEDKRKMKKGSHLNEYPSESRSKMKKNSSNLRTSSCRVTPTDDESGKEEEASYSVRDRRNDFRKETEGKKKGGMKKGSNSNENSSESRFKIKKNSSNLRASNYRVMRTDDESVKEEEASYTVQNRRNDFRKETEGKKKGEMKKGSNSNENSSESRSKMKRNSSNLRTSSCRVMHTDDESVKEEETSYSFRDRGNDFRKETEGKKKVEMKKDRNSKNVGDSRISVNKIPVKDNRSDLGAPSCPLSPDDELEEKPEDSRGGGGEEEKEDVSYYYVRETGNDIHKETEGKNKGGTKRSNSKDVRNSRISVNKILVDSIWEKGGAGLEKLVQSREQSPDEVASLPLIFSFDSDEDIEVVEKSYWELEAEKLFQEMDYVLGLASLGSSDVDMVDFEEDISSQTKKDLGCCLDGGNHHLVLNEEIGISCTICHFVLQEIRNIQPEFGKPRCRRGGARDFYRVDGSNMHDFENEEFIATDHPSFEHSKGTVWDLIPGIRNSMFPHQQEGFEFIWKNIADSLLIEDAKKCISEGGGSGCIISHAPGTGKTRLAILFLQTYMKLNPDSRPVIIAPCSMLLTWEEEFRKWKTGIPFHNLNFPEYSNQESRVAISLLKNARQGQNLETSRLVKLFSWRTEKSVLGISYQLFEELCRENALIDTGKKKATDVRVQIRKMLLELPGILVLDEGHIPRNNGSQILKALLQVQTERKIMLSGTPFQNNFDELWNTFRLVRRRFPQDVLNQSQGKSRMKGKRVEEEAKAEFASMTDNIGKVNDEKVDKLKKMMSEFVHVYKGSVLKEKLLGLKDSVVVLSPTNLQKELAEEAENIEDNFSRDHLLTLISIHPSLFTSSPRYELETLRLDPNVGVKTRFLTELIRLSWALKERVLVFSLFIDPLTLVIKQLRSLFHWTEGKEILFMSGEHSEKQRQLSINQLNDPESDVRVMLASTRACSEGINLVGASRVVLLDVVWNPSIKRQSMSRAYRLGQKKVVHVYHLIAGKWEWDKYRSQAKKDRISDLVFFTEDGAANKPQNLGSVDEDKVLQDMVEHPSMRNIFVKVQHQPKDSDLLDMFD